MTITKIYIGAFGGLKDYTLELDRGLNVIFGENENGKSTVMAFIKMMFYGNAKNSRQISKNPRQKYRPWSGDSMGGRIYFEHQNHRYCLEREFKKSNSGDKVILRNLDLGTSETVSSDIGKRFFDLSEEAFENSVFINGTGIYEANETASGELNAKLSNIAVTGDESTSYQLISNRIHTAVNDLTTQRHVGIYDKGLARLEELKAQYKKADESANRRDALNNKIKVLKNQLAEVKAHYDSIKRIVDSENDIRMAEKMREYLEVKRELDELNKTLALNDGKQLDTVFIGKVNFCLSKLETEQRRESEKQSELKALESTLNATEQSQSLATPQRLNELKSDIESLRDQKKNIAAKYEAELSVLEKAKQNLHNANQKRKAFHAALLITGIIVLLCGLVAAYFYLPLIAVSAVGAVLSVLSFIIRPVDKDAIDFAREKESEIHHHLTELKSKEAALQGDINDLVNKLNLMTATINTDKALLDRKETEIYEKRNQLHIITEHKNIAFGELISLFSRYKPVNDPDQIREMLISLTDRTEEQKKIKLRLKYLSQDLGNISYEEAAQKLAAITTKENNTAIDFNKEKLCLDKLNEEGINISSTLSALRTELKNELKYAIDPETIQREITELSSQLERQKQYIDAANIAAEVLEDSFAEVRRGYGSELEKRTLEIFSALTGGRYGSINVSKTMELEAETTGEFTSRSIEYLSAGTIDQAYLSLRLAIAELMANEERLPILLDDALSQYDDKRAIKALEFLKNYAKDTQIVLFTCHNSICKSAEESEIAVKALKP